MKQQILGYIHATSRGRVPKEDCIGLASQIELCVKQYRERLDRGVDKLSYDSWHRECFLSVIPPPGPFATYASWLRELSWLAFEYLIRDQI